MSESFCITKNFVFFLFLDTFLAEGRPGPSISKCCCCSFWWWFLVYVKNWELRIGNWEWFLVWVEGGNKLYNLTHCCSKTPSWISAGWVSPKLVGDFFYSRAYIAFGVILSNIFIVQRFWRKKVNFPKSMGWVGVVGYKFHGFCTFWPRWSQKPAEFETEAEKRQSAADFVISVQ